jgi:hypothetical protein
MAARDVEWVAATICNDPLARGSPNELPTVVLAEISERRWLR